MKRSLVLLLFSLASILAAVNVDVRANKVYDLTPAENCENPKWLRPNPRSWVRCQMPDADENWKQGTFTLSAEKECQVSFVLESGKTQSVVFRNITADGTMIRNGDFSKTSQGKAPGWQGNYTLASLNGGSICISGSYAATRINLPEKKPVTFRFEYRLATEKDKNALSAARIDVRCAKTDRMKPGENCFTATWVKENPDGWLRSNTPPPGEGETEGEFSFIPMENFHASLILGATYDKQPVIYTSIKAEGAKINNGDFKYTGGEGLSGWTGKYKVVPGEKNNAILICPPDTYAATRIVLKKDVKVTIRYRMRKASPQEVQLIKELQPVPVSQAQKKTFECDGWKFSFDEKSGAHLELSRNGKILFRAEKMLENPFDFRTDRGNLSAYAKLKLDSYQIDEKNKKIDLFYSADGWNFKDTFEFGYGGKPERLRRSFSFFSETDQVRRFYRIRFPHRHSGDGEYFSPGLFFSSSDGIWGINKLRRPLESNRKGRISEKRFLQTPHYTTVFVFRPDNGPTIVCFDNRQTEGGNIQLSRTHLTIQHNPQGWAEKGKVQKLDDYLLETSELAPELAVKECIHPMMRSVGAVRSADAENWMLDRNFYGLLLPRMSNTTFAAAAGEVVRVREMGFNAIWFPPLQDGTVSYVPIDFYSPEPKHGTWDEWKKLVSDLNRNGVAVLMDIVPHGGMVPQLIQRNISSHGLFLNGRPADYNSPEWNDYMRKVAKFYAEMGIQGFRVDAPAGSLIPNWRRKGFPKQEDTAYIQMNELWAENPRKIGKITQAEWDRFTKNTGISPELSYDRASMSGAAGGNRISKTIRDGLRSVCGNGATILETHGFPTSMVGDSTYDIMLRQLPYQYQLFPVDEFVRRAANYLDESRYIDVENAIYMRNLANNDDLQTIQLAGPGLTRPMFALMYFSEGFPIGYSGSDFGHAAFLRTLNALRSENHVLRRGKVSYSASGDLLEIKRVYGKENALIRINFSPLPCDGVKPFGVEITVNGKRKSLSEPGVETALKNTALKLSGNTVKGADYQLVFDPATGLPEQMDLVSMPGSKVVPEGFSIREKDGKVYAESLFSGNRKILFECSANDVKIKTEGEGFSLIWKSGNEFWQAMCGSALLEDWVSPEFAKAPRSESSFHPGQKRLPQIDGLLYNSRQYPLSPGRQEICFFPKQGIGESFFFPDKVSPVVEIHRQFGGVPGIHLLWKPDEKSNRMIIRPAGRRLTEQDLSLKSCYGKTSLTDSSSKLIVENDFYKVILSKSGTVLSLQDKTKGTNEEGFAEIVLSPEKKGAPFRMFCDAESSLRIIGKEHDFQLVFDGVLAKNYRARSRFGIRNRTVYTFDENQGFLVETNTSPELEAFPGWKLKFQTFGSGWDMPDEIVSPFPQKSYSMKGGWNRKIETKTEIMNVRLKDFQLQDIALRYSVRKKAIMYR